MLVIMYHFLIRMFQIHMFPGIPGAMTFFAISWILGTVTYILVHLKKKTMDRIFVRAYVGTFVCRSLGLLFLTIYWLYYESSGYQKSPLEDVGRSA